MKTYILYLTGLMLVLALVVIPQALRMDAQAEQVIMLDMMFFIPDKSDFILDDGERAAEVTKAIRLTNTNVWDIFKEDNALDGTALGAPGDNDFASNVPLIYKLPVPVKDGEAGPWKMWARLSRVDDPNSFWWRAGQDGRNWNPNAFNIDTHGWNNPGGAEQKVPDKPPWFWFAGLGAPDFQPGDNYLMLSCRESGVPPNVNLIDAISIRNDGNIPTDEEAIALLAEQYKGVKSPFEGEAPESVSPRGKLTTTWGILKSQ